MNFLVTQFSPPSHHLIRLQSNYPPQYSVLKHPQSMYLPYISHPYRTKGKIIVLYVIIFKLFVSRRDDRRFWTEW
jgi:hypothetical protein